MFPDVASVPRRKVVIKYNSLRILKALEIDNSSIAMCIALRIF